MIETQDLNYQVFSNNNCYKILKNFHKLDGLFNCHDGWNLMVVVVEEKDNSNCCWWKILMVIDVWGNRDNGKENEGG